MVDGGKKGETGEFTIILRNEGLTGTGAGLTNWDREINLYPNPSSGDFTLELPALQRIPASVEVFNAQGLLVKAIPGIRVQRHIPVSMGPVAPGIYHLKLCYGDDIFYRKIVIE